MFYRIKFNIFLSIIIVALLNTAIAIAVPKIKGIGIYTSPAPSPLREKVGMRGI